MPQIRDGRIYDWKQVEIRQLVREAFQREEWDDGRIWKNGLGPRLAVWSNGVRPQE